LALGHTFAGSNQHGHELALEQRRHFDALPHVEGARRFHQADDRSTFGGSSLVAGRFRLGAQGNGRRDGRARGQPGSEGQPAPPFRSAPNLRADDEGILEGTRLHRRSRGASECRGCANSRGQRRKAPSPSWGPELGQPGPPAAAKGLRVSVTTTRVLRPRATLERSRTSRSPPSSRSESGRRRS
jgi:hypothetical protein